MFGTRRDEKQSVFIREEPFVRLCGKQSLFRGSAKAPPPPAPSPTKRPTLHTLSTTSCNTEGAGRERRRRRGEECEDDVREKEERRRQGGCSERGT